MKPLNTSSGDLIADRRADYAEMLFQSGDHPAAAELMLGAMELAPGWALGWFRLGEMYEAAGRGDQAVEAWRTVLKLDPDDCAGAALKLELAGVAPKSASPPGAFVEALFDQYAETFDASLVGKLAYRVPDLLLDALRPFAGGGFGLAIDLGCGTGLMGERLRPLARRLEGFDISAAMLKKAEAKGVYDRLAKADLQTLELTPGSVDLVVAADVFMYVGALEGIVPMVAAALRPAGIFAFSVERNAGPELFTLKESRRYAHSETYLNAILGAAGFAVRSVSRENIRMDRGEAIEGLILTSQLAISSDAEEMSGRIGVVSRPDISGFANRRRRSGANVGDWPRTPPLRHPGQGSEATASRDPFRNFSVTEWVPDSRLSLRASRLPG